MKTGKRVLKEVREKYPTEDPYEICKREGITLIRVEMEENRLGFYLPVDTKCRVVMLQAGQSPEEEREVVANGLYYYFAGVKPKPGPIERRRFLRFFPYLIGHWQANSFAALLLCPSVSKCHSVREIMEEYSCDRRVAENRWKLEEEAMNYGGE